MRLVRGKTLGILVVFSLFAASCGGGGGSTDGSGSKADTVQPSTRELPVKVEHSRFIGRTFPMTTAAGGDAYGGNMGGHAVIDFNGDGLLDFIVTPGYEFAAPELPVIAFKQTADDSFVDATDELFPQGAPTTGMVHMPMVADFNGDGRQDYFGPDGGIAGAGSENHLLLSGAGGKFTTSKVGPHGSHFGACKGDFDNDGDIDIVVAAMGVQRTYALLNSPSGFAFDQASVPQELAQGAGEPNFGMSACALADMDNDGWLDLVASAYGDGVAGNQAGAPYATGTRIYLNDKQGRFLPPSSDLPRPPGADWGATSVQAVDFDKNGLLDLMVSYETGTDQWGVGYWAQTATGQYVDRTLEAFTRYETGIGYWRDMDIVDYTGDGYPDIFFRGAGMHIKRVFWAEALSSQFLISDGTGKLLRNRRPLVVSDRTDISYVVVGEARDGELTLLGADADSNGTYYTGFSPTKLIIDFN